MTLYASTAVSHKKWVENVTRQQEVMRERSMFFEMEALNEGFFIGPGNTTNCAAPFSEFFLLSPLFLLLWGVALWVGY